MNEVIAIIDEWFHQRILGPHSPLRHDEVRRRQALAALAELKERLLAIGLAEPTDG